jgi:HEPN domain-containing protein
MDEKTLSVSRWLTKAGNDLLTAETMLAAAQPTPDTICFHAQQCMEKCLKAFLVWHDQDFEKIHDLVPLLELCIPFDSTFETFRECAILLTDYAVEARYPDEWREIPVDEAREAVAHAKRFSDFVKDRIDLGTQPHDQPTATQ